MSETENVNDDTAKANPDPQKVPYSWGDDAGLVERKWRVLERAQKLFDNLRLKSKDTIYIHLWIYFVEWYHIERQLEGRKIAQYDRVDYLNNESFWKWFEKNIDRTKSEVYQDEAF